MKEEDTRDFVTFKQVFACISILGSLIVLTSLHICRRWRARMPPLKWILGAIGVFNLCSAINYLYFDKSDDTVCRVQASMLQFFEMGSTMYALVMAVETHVLLGILSNRLQRLRFQMDGRRTALRHFSYHTCIVLYGAGTVLWMNLTDSYGGNGTWCWIKKPYYRLYLFYIPTWMSILAIAYLDVEVVRVVYRSYQLLRSGADRHPPTSEDSNVDLDRTQRGVMNAKMLRVFLRMILYPLCLSLLVLPGSVVRVIQAGGYNIDNTVFRVLSVARNMCDPSFGTLNVIMWIFSDAEVLAEWRDHLREAGVPIALWPCCFCSPAKSVHLQEKGSTASLAFTTTAQSSIEQLSVGLIASAYESNTSLPDIESTPIVDANNSIFDYISNVTVPPVRRSRGDDDDFPVVVWTD